MVGLVDGSSPVVAGLSSGWVVVAPGRGRLPGTVVLEAGVVVGAMFSGDTVVATIMGIGIGGSDATIEVVVLADGGSDVEVVNPTRSTTENESYVEPHEHSETVSAAALTVASRFMSLCLPGCSRPELRGCRRRRALGTRGWCGSTVCRTSLLALAGPTVRWSWFANHAI